MVDQSIGDDIASFRAMMLKRLKIIFILYTVNIEMSVSTLLQQCDIICFKYCYVK